MKDTKALLTSSVEVVTFLLTAFGGFLKKIAPPDQTGASYSVGAMSFLMLIVLMIASAVGRNKLRKRPWLIAGVVLFFFALIAAFVYPYALSRYTYPQFADPKTRRINASEKYLSPDARQYLAANPNATPEELDRNLPDGDIWTHAGIQRAELWLLAAYGCLVLSISGAIFSLLEANLSETTKSNAVSG